MPLETPGWRALEFDGNSLANEEVEGQKENFLLALFLKHERERVFTKDLLVGESGAADPKLPLLARARVSSLEKIFRFGGSYELVEKP